MLVGLAAFVAGGFAVHRLYLPQLARAQAEATMLRDRLLQAWRDGYTVPDAIDLARSEPAEKPVPSLVLGFLEQYDDEGRRFYEARARRLLAQGHGPEAVVRMLAHQPTDEAVA